MTDQSIYNIIPKEYPQPPKQSIYKSKYPPNIPPTGSTFCHHTTSRPKVSNVQRQVGNVAGQFNRDLQPHTQYGQTKTFGHLKGQRKPSPNDFLKSKTGIMGNEQLPPIRDFSYDKNCKKPSIPKVSDKPIQGLKSNKNFIVSNAIENILSTAKVTPEPVDWLKKKDFGRNPDYIQKVKQNITKQYEMIQNLHRQYEQNPTCLSEDEVRELRDGLKHKWEELNKEYQKKTYIRLVDTVGSKTKKESLEAQLAEIQRDIKKLNKTYVFLED